ncbi:MAG: phasin family protein [Alphaproteobacteria bacterium]|nr:phasin family protein [Alphaproteobacteria bacterium]
MIKTYEDMVSFNKDNMDAMVKSSNTWSKGVEQLSKECFSFMGRSMDAVSSNAQKYTTCKSAVEAIQLGNDHAKSVVEDWVSQGKKVADISNGIAQEAVAPINARCKIVSETVNNAMNTSMNSSMMNDFASQWNNCCNSKK